MKRLAVSCISFLFVAGCMTGPHDGSAIPDRFKTMTFQGYALSANAPVEIEIQRAGTSVWDVFATTTSGTNATVDTAGRSWYYWSVNAAPPRSGRYWPKVGSSGRAEMRARVATTLAYRFTAAQMSCTAAAISAGSDYVSASSDCGSVVGSVTISAPCDEYVGGGCYDFPTHTQITDYPFDRSMEFSNGLQGVTHSSNYWYFTSAHRTISNQWSRIAKVHVGTNLNNNISYFGNPYSPGHKHFGDLDYHNNRLYVALEPGDGTASYNAIGIFNTSLQYYPLLPIPAGTPQRNGSLPWIARNPKDGLFYSSRFHGDKLYKYQVTTSAVTYVGSVSLNKTLHEVQGGDFTESGRLYLSTNTHESKAVNVVELVDDNSAVVVGTGDLTWDPDGENEEIEGITVWDLDDGRAPGVRGQVHVLMFQGDWASNDNWYFKHMRLSPSDEY